MLTRYPVRCFLLGALLMGASHAHAQGGVGWKAGFHMSTLFSQAQNNDLIPGGHLGVYFPLAYGNRFELQPEVLFSMQGSARTYNEDNTRTLRLYYAQVPVSAKYFITPILNIQGGVQLGYLGMASARTEEGSEDVTDDLQRLDMSFIMGLGFDMMDGWDLTFRYSSGMTNVLKGDDVLFPSNRLYGISIGHRLVKQGKGTRRRHRSR